MTEKPIQACAEGLAINNIKTGNLSANYLFMLQVPHSSEWT